MNLDWNFYKMETKCFHKYVVITYKFNNGTVIEEIYPRG